MLSPTMPHSSSTQVTLGDPGQSIRTTIGPLTSHHHTGNARQYTEISESEITY
jgi:hypothetical protein